MSARAIASSTISFGLVSLPVKLYATSESGHRIGFNLVHGECGTRLKQQYICPKCEVVVPREDMVKGYEFSKGQYVLFDDEELKALEAPKTDGIEITEFVGADQVEPIYLDRSYYLGPDKGGARAYRLLSAALREVGRVAIAKYATRGKQYLVMIRPHGDGLILDQLRYAEEVRSFDEVPIDEAEVKDAELQLAQKVEGEEITVQPAEAPATQIIDLMAALKASLGDDGEGTERKPAGRAGKKKAATKKKAAEG